MSSVSKSVSPALFAALSDGARLAIVEKLSVSRLSVGEIAAALSISYASASQHLKVLRMAGLVDYVRSGRRLIYSVEPTALGNLAGYFSSLRESGSSGAGAPDGESRAGDREFEREVSARWGCWPDIDPIVAAISAWTRYVSQVLETMKDDVGARLGVTARDADLLGVLYRIGKPHESTPTELARISLLSLPRMTKRLDHLEDQGLISRTAHPEDRRSRIVRLTPRGADVVSAVMARHMNNCEQQLLGDLPRGERFLMARSLWRVAVAAGTRRRAAAQSVVDD